MIIIINNDVFGFLICLNNLGRFIKIQKLHTPFSLFISHLGNFTSKTVTYLSTWTAQESMQVLGLTS